MHTVYGSFHSYRIRRAYGVHFAIFGVSCPNFRENRLKSFKQSPPHTELLRNAPERIQTTFRPDSDKIQTSIRPGPDQARFRAWAGKVQRLSLPADVPDKDHRDFLRVRSLRL